MGSVDAIGPPGPAPSLPAFVAEGPRQRLPAGDAALNAAVDRLRHRLGDRLISLDAGFGREGANGRPLHS